jgi:HEAT repeat protein
MKYACYVAVVFCQLCSVLCGMQNRGDLVQSTEQSNQVKWCESREDAEFKAKFTGKRILLFIRAEFSPVCDVIVREMEGQLISKKLADYHAVQIDIILEPEYLRKYPTGRSIPSVIVIDESGETVATNSTKLFGSDFAQWLADNSGEDEEFEKQRRLNNQAELPLSDLIKALRHEDSEIRKIAVDRLAKLRAVAGPAVFEVLIEGPALSRESAVTVLSGWGAPVTGIEPENLYTLTEERLQKIDHWLYPLEFTLPNALSDSNVQLYDRYDGLINDFAIAAADKKRAIVEELSEHIEIAATCVAKAENAATEKSASQSIKQLQYLILASKRLRKQEFEALTLLADDDSAVRCKAISSILTLVTREDRRLISKLIDDPNAAVRVLATEGLDQFDILATEEYLKKLIDDSSFQVRIAALTYANECPSVNIKDAVNTRLAKEDDPEVILALLRYLLRFPSDADPAVVIRLADHKSVRIRTVVAEILGDLSFDFPVAGERTTTQNKIQSAIDRLVLDPDQQVADTAFRKFRLACTEKSVETLFQVFEAHPYLIEIYIHGMNWDIPFSEDDFAIIDSTVNTLIVPRLERLSSHKDAAVRRAVIAAYAKFDSHRLDSRIQSFLNDSDIEVRKAAISYLIGKASYKRCNWRPKPNGIGTDFETWIAPEVISAESFFRSFSKFLATVQRTFSPTWFFGVSADKILIANVSSDDELPPLYHEQWILRYAAAMRTDGMFRQIQRRLVELSHSSDAEEAALAAVCLFAYGDFTNGFDSLTIDTDGSTLNRLEEQIYGWLPYEHRLRYLKKRITANPDDLAYQIFLFSSVRNHNAVEEIWSMIADAEDPEFLSDSIEQLYFSKFARNGIRQDAVNQVLFQHLKEDLESKISGSNPCQQFVALKLMRKYFNDDAIFFASSLSAFTEDKYVKRICAEIMLDDDNKRDEYTLDFVKSENQEAATVAMRNLVLRIHSNDHQSRQLLKELPVVDVNRWLASDNIETTSLACCLLAELGQSKDFEPLYSYQRNFVNDIELAKAFTQTIIDVGDDDQMLALEHLYRDISTDLQDDRWRRLYIQSLSQVGRHALNFRAELRKKLSRGYAIRLGIGLDE